MSAKLKLVRDKTHFHIDRDAVLSPQTVWKEADIKGLDLATCLDSLWKILDFLHARHFGLPFNAPSYDGTDATRIVNVAQTLRDGVMVDDSRRGSVIGEK